MECQPVRVEDFPAAPLLTGPPTLLRTQDVHSHRLAGDDQVGHRP